MNKIEIAINKVKVYDEVAKTTSYTGVKMKDDDAAYERIFTTDDDRIMLERFWNESCIKATQEFKPFLLKANEHFENHGVNLDQNYDATLEISASFDINLIPGIQASLFSFFVNYITGKWYKFSNKNEAELYLNEADNHMLDVSRKLYYRKKPKRITPN